MTRFFIGGLNICVAVVLGVVAGLLYVAQTNAFGATTCAFGAAVATSLAVLHFVGQGGAWCALGQVASVLIAGLCLTMVDEPALELAFGVCLLAAIVSIVSWYLANKRKNSDAEPSAS